LCIVQSDSGEKGGRERERDKGWGSCEMRINGRIYKSEGENASNAIETTNQIESVKTCQRAHHLFPRFSALLR
jgi:hypothetical protein